MAETLYELLHRCTVRIFDPATHRQGTGFFVAPGLVVTCAHVVQGAAPSATVMLYWQAQPGQPAQALRAMVERQADIQDIALLRLDNPLDHPCVWLGEDAAPFHSLYSFGYPARLAPNGTSTTVECEGWTEGETGRLLSLKAGQVAPGMSGSPLLNVQTGLVCGVIARTRDEFTALGGRAIPTQTLWKVFPDVQNAQANWQQQDQRWRTCLEKHQQHSAALVFAASSHLNGGSIFDVPELPVRFIDRPLERDNLCAALQEQTIVGLVATVVGQGGIGKTYLATLLCHDPEIRERFPDGILWATLGQDADENTVKAIQQRWLTRLGADTISLSTLSDGKEQLKQRLEGRTMLLVIDDVWNGTLAHWVRCSSPTVRVLMTTRDLSQIPDAYPYRLDVLLREQSWALLDQVSEGCITSTEAEELAELVGDLPLGLSVLGGQMADEFVTWKALKAEFQTNLLEDFPDEFNRLIYAAIKTSIDALGDKKQRYLELAVFPNEVRLEPTVVIRYWSQTAGLSEFAAQRLLPSMVKKSLIQKDNTLHDLPYAYLQHSTSHEERRGWHNALIAVYGASETWGDLPDNENSYGWWRLAWHLAQADRQDDLRSLLLNASYLQHKIERLKAASLASDMALLPYDTDITLLDKTIRLSQHILDERLQELPNQIMGRAGKALYPLFHDWAPWSEAHFRLHSQTLDQAGSDLLRIMQHQNEVTACMFSPDGHYALSACNERTLRLWDLRTGDSLHTFREYAKGIALCTFSPDERYVLSASDDSTLCLWDVQTGQSVHTFQEHWNTVSACMFSPDGRYVLSASDDSTLRLWDVQTGQSVHTFQGHSDTVRACAFSPDGQYALSASGDCTLRLWDVQTGGSRRIWKHHERVGECAFSPDGRYALSATSFYYSTMHLWDVQTGESHHTWEHFGGIIGCAFSPDGRYVFSISTGEGYADNDNQPSLLLWDLQTGRNWKQFGSVNMGIFSPDGRYVLSVSDDRIVRLLSSQTGKIINYWESDRHLMSIAIDSSGRHVIVGDESGAVHFLTIINIT